VAEFFIKNFIEVYFFYGLAFFCMGFAILLEAGRKSDLEFARALHPLGYFGLLHGSHEWFEMFLLIHSHLTTDPTMIKWLYPVRIVLLAISFYVLILFGIRLISNHLSQQIKVLLTIFIAIVWLTGLSWVYISQSDLEVLVISADVYTRYALAIPGAFLVVWGLFLQRRRFIRVGMESVGNDLALAAIGFGAYGGIGQLFVSPSPIFPSSYFNVDNFITWFGFPIQVLRALMACLAAVFTIRSLRAFEMENYRKIENLRELQLSERRRLESLRAELLHRTVKAQEAERQRIAQELHDETGQALTAMALGLRGLSDVVSTDPQKAILLARQLQNLASQSINELQRLVSGLHPPQLDDFGLVPALRSYIGEIQNRFNLAIQIKCVGPERFIPIDVRVVLFRIVQEGITNIVRHAEAQKVIIVIDTNETEINLQVEDDGIGFNVDAALNQGLDAPSWGLLGMIERASLVNGTCRIISELGKGAIIMVKIPLVDDNGSNT
jgi:signal transduction histidine kinase